MQEKIKAKIKELGADINDDITEFNNITKDQEHNVNTECFDLYQSKQTELIEAKTEMFNFLESLVD